MLLLINPCFFTLIFFVPFSLLITVDNNDLAVGFA